MHRTKIKEISKPYQISHSLNLPMLVDSSLIDMLKPMTQNSKVSFVLKGANLAMNASEKNLDETLEPPFISSAIKKYFNENFHSSFSDEENAEYAIKLNVYTKPRSEGMNEYGFYFVYAYAEITITETSSNKEVYSKSYTQIKGGHTSKNLAGQKALKKLLKEIEIELPHIASQLLY